MTLEEFLAEWHNDNPRILVHTSGSTGQPKPLWVEKRRMEASARITCEFLGLQRGDTALLCMPLDYIAGKMMVVRSLVGGLRMVSVTPSSHPLHGVSESVDFAAMVPLQVFNSLRNARERELLREVRQLIIGGGAVDETLAAELRDFPHAVWSTYGMTETLSHIALRRLSGPEASEWYEPFPSVAITQNADGCLVVDAPLVCPHPLTTNDIVEMESMGTTRFRILGRKDNVVCSGGLKIQIEEVERLLRGCLSIPFMITKRKDSLLGEAMVLLYKRNEQTILAPADRPEMYLQRVCRDVLPRYWQPKDYVGVARLPLTATGKPARATAEQLASAILREGSPRLP